MNNLSFHFETGPSVFTVAELTETVNAVLARDFDDVRVMGEISGFKVGPSGHAYFTLKDSKASVSCVCWASTLRLLRHKPKDGMAVVLRGNLEVYPARGQLQLYVKGLEPQGLGELMERFEKLKRQLESEGLFDPQRKRPLPPTPHRIGIVTSPTGAAIRDLLTVLLRRFPLLQVRLYPALVQGAGAAAQIAEGLDYFSNSGWAELVIAGRGGGSLEDLWAFNEEAVARAIARCSVPVISAVGHETDFTIADFVADRRAPTPSAAAEMAVPVLEDLLEAVNQRAHRNVRAMRLRLSEAARRVNERGVERATRLLQRRIALGLQSLDDHDSRMAEKLRGVLAAGRRRMDHLDSRLKAQDLRVRLAKARERMNLGGQASEERMRRHLHRAAQALTPLEARLQALSPLQVLERGYSIVQTSAGAVVKRPADAPGGTRLRIRTAGGDLPAEALPS